jgi:hypothetical protein
MSSSKAFRLCEAQTQPEGYATVHSLKAMPL